MADPSETIHRIFDDILNNADIDAAEHWSDQGLFSMLQQIGMLPLSGG